MDIVDDGKAAVEKILDENGDTPIRDISPETIERGKTIMEDLIEKYGDFPIKANNTMTFKDELSDAFPIFNDELDTSFLLELLYYFPIEKTYIAAGSYDQYLYDLEKTVIDNYDTGNFQVSFFYAHLIFMSYVYYCVEKAYKLEPERMKDIFYPINAYSGKNDKPNIENYGSVYEFSKIPEKEIFKVFHILGMDDPTIKEFSNYLRDRNDFAHATGKGNISEQEFRQNIKTVIGNMNRLSELFLSHLKSLYIDFMLERLDYGYEAIMDNFNDIVFDNALSIRDLEYLCRLGVKNLQESNENLKANYQVTRNIHCAFLEYCYINYGIELPDGYVSLRNDNFLFYRYKYNAKAYVENELGINEYQCIKDGGELPVYECPECGVEQLAYDADTHRYHCFACDANYSDEDLAFCERCGSLMRRNDEFPVCQNCIEDMMKD